MFAAKLWQNKTESKNVKVAKIVEFIETYDHYPRRFIFETFSTHNHHPPPPPHPFFLSEEKQIFI